jgi:selenocysteine lyase/cysteine desulfurase
MVAIRAQDDAALVGILNEAGIVTSCRDGNLRIALHFYNDERDVESLFTALKRHRHLLV